MVFAWIFPIIYISPTRPDLPHPYPSTACYPCIGPNTVSLQNSNIPTVNAGDLTHLMSESSLNNWNLSVAPTLRETEQLGCGCQKSNQFLVMVMGICCKVLDQIHETVHELSCLQAFPHFRPCDLDLWHIAWMESGCLRLFMQENICQSFIGQLS